MHDEGTDSRIKVFANIFISFIGAGILGLPYAFKEVCAWQWCVKLSLSLSLIRSERDRGRRGGHQYRGSSQVCIPPSLSSVVYHVICRVWCSIKAMFLLIDCKNRMMSKTTLTMATKLPSGVSQSTISLSHTHYTSVVLLVNQDQCTYMALLIVVVINDTFLPDFISSHF